MGTVTPRWKIRFEIAALFGAAMLFMVVPKPALALTQDQCVSKANISIDPLEKVLKNAGIEEGKVCDEQSKFDDGKHCKESFTKLEKLEKDRQAIIVDRCQNGMEMEKVASCNNTECQKNRAKLVTEAADFDKDEKTLLAKMRAELNEIREYQLKLAEGAKQIQEDTHSKSQSNPDGRDANDIDKLGKARGTKYSNNKEAASFFKDPLSAVSSAISSVSQGSSSASEVNQLQTPLTREPLQIAVASNAWDKQMEAREQTLTGQGKVYNAQAATGNSRSSDMSSLGSGAQAASQATQAAQTASNDTASGGGSSGGGGGGGSSANGSSSTPSPSSYSNPTSYASNGGTTTADTYQPTAAGKVGLAASTSSDKKSGTNSIDNVETVIAANDTALPSSTGASTSKSSALRSALRDRLNGMSSRGGGGSSTGASTAPGSGGTGAMASSGAVPDALLPETKAVASEDPLAASAGSTGGDLGNTDFSMGGSETEAAVNGMLKDFNVGHEDGGRGLASSGSSHNAPEILAKDSASLFLRARETHLRALKGGLVINGLRSKL